jgi:hypothetical protein
MVEIDLRSIGRVMFRTGSRIEHGVDEFLCGLSGNQEPIHTAKSKRCEYTSRLHNGERPVDRKGDERVIEGVKNGAKEAQV